MKRDQIALDTAHDKLMLAWGKSMAEQLDLPALARSLTAQENLLVRLELPVGEALKEPPATARLLSLANNTTPVEASFFSLPTTADPQSQGQGFIFLVKGNALRLAPGAAVLGWLKAPGDPLAGVTVPRSAVVRALGQTWVYVQTGDDTFARRPIALEHPVESGWLVTAGLQPGERIVTAAAQVLLSEELKSQIKLLE
jgi:multidrug efflux pump subunit AcrA (membrane-fusion protein)